MKCIDCGTETGSGRLKRCIPHRDAHTAAMVLEQNRRASDRMKARRAATRRKCVICGEDTEHKKVKYCATHRAMAAAERKSMREKKAGEDWRVIEAMKKAREEAEDSILVIPAKPWKPRPKPAPLLSHAEQSRHDIALDRRLAERCGYGHGDVRRLTKEEIESLSPLLSPPVEAVKVGYCDRLVTEGWA
jgi:hypothetical protein